MATNPHIYADILRAIADGKPMQILTEQGWSACSHSCALQQLSLRMSRIRIAPEPRYQWLVRDDRNFFRLTNEHYSSAEEASRGCGPGATILKLIEETRRDE